jgi:hypothetical protein
LLRGPHPAHPRQGGDVTHEELSDALDGLHAYDSGCTDSGIHDEALRARVKAHLATLDDDKWRWTMSRIVRDLYLSEEALEQGYGLEDVAGCIKWLADRMEIDL